MQSQAMSKLSGDVILNKRRANNIDRMATAVVSSHTGNHNLTMKNGFTLTRGGW